jgi:predicted 3-demethylubiquinone-9 3-methyltransferase (glyoxalase superfamily)
MQIYTFLMFEGKAAEAMQFYLSLFEDASVKQVSFYGANEPGPEGTVKHAIFTLNGQDYMCIDSPAKHGFTFTPAMSLYVNTESEAKVDELYNALSAGGNVMMPLGAYPFSKKFGWVSDKYGVSWQINLADK